LPACLLVLAAALCAPGASADGSPELFTVVCYNLNNYIDPELGYSESKPAKSREACLDALARMETDVLVLLEVGGDKVARSIAEGLGKRGAEYPFTSVVAGDDEVRRIAVLAKKEPAEVDHEVSATYNMGEEVVPVQRGFANCLFAWPNGYRLRLISAHLKSKRYHPLGQTDMRRYESRQLRYLVNRYVLEDTEANILVIGDFNDNPRSSPLNTLFNRRRRAEGELYDLRPLGKNGLSWTHFWSTEDIYSRIDYALVSHGLLAEIDYDKTEIVAVDNWYALSDHRPIRVTLRTQDGELKPEVLAQFERNIRKP
jgi:endonuclease/exonuclease/phosphatase family metal-dependent hydrolase